MEQSRERYGSNVLTPPRQRSVILQFLDKFNDPLIKILLVALLLSIGIAGYQYFFVGGSNGSKLLLEPMGIFTAIVLATLIGFLVELNANKKFKLLNQMNDSQKVKVRRDGRVTTVERRDVVVGDVVMLEAGDKVPADGRLLRSVSMRLNESSFTGEPSVMKSHKAAEQDPAATYATNELLRGSTVIEGYGEMRVTRVGDNTEYGKIYTEVQIENDVQTPLMRQLEQLGGWISKGSYIVGVLIVLGRLVAYVAAGDDLWSLMGAEYMLETVMLAVTVVVVSVPEGLPMSVTLSLALSMRRMLQTNNLVRRMHACETMGSTTVICTDKTGTLTRNMMQVSAAVFKDEINACGLSADDAVNLSMAANSTAHIGRGADGRTEVIGNSTEGALLMWLEDRGVAYGALRDEAEVLIQLPFSAERKYMATVVRVPETDRRLLLVKGAPEVVMAMCAERDGKAETELAVYQSKAMRTLAFALKEDVGEDTNLCSLSGLAWLGYVAISDPVRDDVPAAVASCVAAGIKVKMVTGDTEVTAREIGRLTGICEADEVPESFVTGAEFAAMDDAEARKRVSKIKVMSRARPDDKSRLVRLLQENDEVVAVTGDGTNDAPALNAAQVGLSMGSGTAVAKEASDITIIDDSFTSINRAVMWGRSLYKNIQRFLAFQLTVNVAACLIVTVCSFFSEQSPLTVTQMLWVNLIMDTLAALALASLPPQESVMSDSPRKPSEAIITRQMRRFIAVMSVPIAVVMSALFFYFWRTANINAHEMSIFFSVFVFVQVWNMLNARRFDGGAGLLSDWKASKVFGGVLLLIVVCQVMIVQLGGQVFSVVPLTLKEWLMIIVGTMPVLLVGMPLTRKREKKRGR